MIRFFKRLANRFRTPRHKLQAAFCFHMNQYFDPYVEVVADVSYRPFLRALLGHPRFKASINATPTLLLALSWLAPDVLAMLREAVKRKQVEILATTFSQAILSARPAALASTDISLALDFHKAVLGNDAVTGRSFWNPERVAWPGLSTLLLDEGFERTLVEAAALEKAGLLDGFRPVVFEKGGKKLEVFVDDEKWRCEFNNALASRHSVDNFVLDLKGLALDGSESEVFVYAEDAEAIGLWAYEAAGLSSAAKVAENFERMLDKLEEAEFLELVTLSEARVSESAVRADASAMPDEVAGWIKRSFHDEKMKFHETEYSDWRDFNERSEEIALFRGEFSRFYERLEKTDYRRWTVKGAGGIGINHSRAASLAATVLFAKQYEFGCPGLLADSSRLYEGAGRGFAALSLATLANTRGRGAYFFDVDEDEKEEVVLVGERIAVAFKCEGPLISLFDYKSGSEYCGSLLAYSSLARERMSEMVNARFWPWLDGIELPDAVQEGSPILRRYALAELAGVNGSEREDVIFATERSALSRSGIRFSTEIGPVRIKREVELSGRTVSLRYRIASRERAKMEFEIETCLLPDYLATYRLGRAGVSIEDFAKESGRRGARIFSPGRTDVVSLVAINRQPDELAISTLVEGAGADMLFSLELEKDVETIIVLNVEISREGLSGDDSLDGPPPDASPPGDVAGGAK
jgi:hypothetical protein